MPVWIIRVHLASRKPICIVRRVPVEVREVLDEVLEKMTLSFPVPPLERRPGYVHVLEQLLVAIGQQLVKVVHRGDGALVGGFGTQSDRSRGQPLLEPLQHGAPGDGLTMYDVGRHKSHLMQCSLHPSPVRLREGVEADGVDVLCGGPHGPKSKEQDINEMR